MSNSESVSKQARRECGRNPVTGAQIRMGVMGSAAAAIDPELAKPCRRLGRALVEAGCRVLTGACPVMPHEVVLGAKEAGGKAMGISPAMHLQEHIDTFASPYLEHDVMVYTGLGLMGRELINIRSSDIAVVADGRCGTLGEFAIAYEEGKLIDVPTGTGGITNVLQDLVATRGKKTGSEVIYDADPQLLVSRQLDRFNSADCACSCKPDCCQCDPADSPHSPRRLSLQGGRADSSQASP